MDDPHPYESEDPNDWINWGDPASRPLPPDNVKRCDQCQNWVRHLIYDPFCSLACRENYFVGQGAGDIRVRKLPTFNPDHGEYEFT